MSDITLIGQEIADLAEHMRTHQDRIIVEMIGLRMEVTRVQAIGIRTDDPGVVLRVVQS